MSNVDPSTLSRGQQLLEAWRVTIASDSKAAPFTLGSFVLGAAIGFGIGWVLPGSGIVGLISSIIFAALFGTLAALFIFSRRAESAAFKRIEGQPGAAAASLNMLRRGWQVTPAVGFNKNQDLVHRAVGRPGVVLIAEGSSSSRVRALLATERTKHARVLQETPIIEVVAGDGEGEVPIRKLSRHILKLKRGVAPAELTEILGRLRALDAQRGTMPIPKGPMPTSMKGSRKAMRG